MTATARAINQAGRRSALSVSVAFVGLVILLTSWHVVAALWPASSWLDVRRVHVNDTVLGTAPTMEVDRVIRQDFHGRWLAEVEKQQRGGGFAVVCAESGSSGYRTDAVMPDQLDLDWWTYPRHCDLEPGVYRVDTVWRFHPPGFPVKEVRYLSNSFTVLAR